MGDDRRELRVRLLGGLTVEGVDERQLGSRKARLVLKRLALARGRVVASDELIDLTWGDNPPSKPNDQLGVLISRLRRVLGADRVPHRSNGYALELDWLDCDELTGRVDEAASAGADGRTTAARAAASAAVALARGPLLPEDEGQWVESERSRCAAAIARAHHIVAEAALASGDAEASAAASEAALGLDPYDETALRLLMRAHAVAGRPASGLAAYVRVRERLAEDLGVAPTAETERVHDELVLGGGDQIAVEHERVESSLAGRDDELRALDAAFSRARRGEAVVAVVRGEAGIGKSALVDAWRNSLRGVTTVACRCDPIGRDLPLQPLLDGIAKQLDALGPAAEGVLADDRPLLSGVVGLRTASGATVAHEPDVTRARLFASMLGVLGRLGSGPVVLIVEDIHDAGASTLEWLAFARRRGRQLLIVVTTRPHGSTLDGSAAAGAIFDGSVIVDLGPLPIEAAASLVGGDVGDRDVADLVARSQGNPLFLLALASASDDDLPTTVREAVDRQAARLGAAASVVRAAAVIGGEVDLDLLADLLDKPVRDVLGDLELALAEGLLVERGAGFEFRHELVRAALEAGTGSARRALLHRDVARILGRRRPHDPLAVAVHARLGGELELAAEAFARAASAAFVRSDVDAAFAHVESAIDLHPTASAIALRARLRLASLDLEGAQRDAAEAVALGGGAEALEISAWVSYYQRHYDEARVFADAGAEVAATRELELSCRAVGGRVRHGAGDLAGAAQQLESAASAPLEVRGVADVWLAHLRVHQGRPGEALDMSWRALLHSDRLAHPFAPLHGRFARIMALGQLGRVDEALQACAELDEARRRAGRAGVRFEGIAANGRAWLLRNVGAIAAADESNEQALAAHADQARLSEAGLTEAYWVAILDLVDGRLLDGDIDGAQQRLATAAGLDEWHGTMAWHQRHRLDLQRARVALAAGEPERAYELAEAVRSDAARRGARRYQLLAAGVAACCRPIADDAAIDELVEGLGACAKLEGWRLIAELARIHRLDALQPIARRSAADVIASAGPHRDSAARWADRVLTASST